jgi:hypothetical protein
VSCQRRRRSAAHCRTAPALWLLLVIGSETHIGKGASEGFARHLLA